MKDLKNIPATTPSPHFDINLTPPIPSQYNQGACIDVEVPIILPGFVNYFYLPEINEHLVFYDRFTYTLIKADKITNSITEVALQTVSASQLFDIIFVTSGLTVIERADDLCSKLREMHGGSAIIRIVLRRWRFL